MASTPRRLHFQAAMLLGALGACGPGANPALVPPPQAPAEPAPPALPATPSAKPELGSFGVELEHRKPSIKPGDDFFAHVNGRWLDSYQLKPDEKRYGSFIKLVYRSEDQVKAIIDELSRKPAPRGSAEQQLRDYFQSYMAAAKLERKGISPLKDELAAIAAIKTREQLVDAFGRSGLAETHAPFSLEVGFDRRNPDRHLLELGHSGLGLPDRSYYLEESFEPVVEQYRAHVATLLGFTGAAPAEAESAAAAIVALETAIAREHWPREQLRDVEKTTNIQSLKAFEAAFPGYAWSRHLKAAGVDPARLQELNVLTPSALKPLIQLVNRTPLPVWKSYLGYHLVRRHAPLLGDGIDDANFAFHGRVLAGQPEQRERWKRGVELIGDARALGELIGKLYVARHFPPESKAQMLELVGNLRAALKERLEKLDWMGPDTKQEALRKLATFNPKVGYPDRWRDFSSIGIVPDDLMANYRAVREYWYRDDIARLGRPTDRDEWFMSPQTVNAYYNPAFNEIVFPAAILQPPFFDPRADPAVNYGAIGAVIGHEMGHGFDDQGSKSDAQGVQRNWWTSEDRARFEARTSRLVQQFARFEPLPGHKVNGQLTLGENIGDLGGVSMALSAYQRSLAGKAAPVLDGTTGEQRFFLAWAQVWASKQRDETLLRALKSHPHSPPEYRVNGVVRNVDAWYHAFGVQPGDALYLPPAERVTIW